MVTAVPHNEELVQRWWDEHARVDTHQDGVEIGEHRAEHG